MKENVMLAKQHIPWPDDTAKRLAQIVSANGKEIYLDVDKLSGELKKSGEDTVKMMQLMLGLEGSSIKRYLDVAPEAMTQIDLNNMVIAISQSGLSDTISRTVLAELLFGLDLFQASDDYWIFDLEKEKKVSGLYVPSYLFKNDMEVLEQRVSSGGSLAGDEYTRLLAYGEANIPEANCLMGKLCLQNSEDPEEERMKKALPYLEKARQYGSVEAVGILGDCYFERKDYASAYTMYSVPGAAAASSVRQDNIRWLYKLREYNNTIIRYWLIWALASIAAIVVLIPFARNTGTHMAIDIIFSVLTVLLSVSLVFHYKSQPLDGSYFRNAGMLYLFLFFIFILFLI
ncbi:MAG TPA: hypothetical protein PLN48_17720 [Lachnospiraceae bacterium]|nr:hypothetical protein [Lachnospiraceae bacterium]